MAEGSGGVLRELLAVFGFGVDTHELEHGENKLNEFFEGVKKVGEGIAAVFAVDQLFEFAEGQVHAMTAVEHLAAQIGISTDEVQAWQFAAQSAGFEADKFAFAMSKLQVAAGNKETGGKLFKELGINIKDASGHAKNASELFTDVAEAVKNTEDPNKRAAIATKLFGRAGRELLPFLTEGREGVEELMAAYKELGGAFSEEDIERTKKFEKQQAKLGLVFKGLKAQISAVLIPVFTKLMELTTKIVKVFVDLVKHSNIVQAALVVLGTAATYFAVQMAIASAPILLIGAAIAGIILLVDELITLFQGGDTLIGRAIDKIFGKDAHVEVVKELKEAWEGVKNTFVSMWPAVKSIWEAFKWMVDHIGDLGGLLGDSLGKGRVAAADLKYTFDHPDAPSSRAMLGTGYTDRQPGGDGLPGSSYQGGDGGVGGKGGEGGSAGDIHVNVHLDGEVIDKRVDRRIKGHTRAAAATLQRAGQPQ